MLWKLTMRKDLTLTWVICVEAETCTTSISSMTSKMYLTTLCWNNKANDAFSPIVRPVVPTEVVFIVFHSKIQVKKVMDKKISSYATKRIQKRMSTLTKTLRTN